MLSEFFHTDWSAMTHADWFGLVTVTLLTVLMAGLYVWVFKPGNKERFERYRNFVNQDDEMNREIGHGQAK
ncbi:MAG: cbb3-type cytochrome c oxidase subunit 3 [Nitrosomonadales bacterium]|nr:cbb3-type cytochrome c oxidase subunit 3 [Nitrosomonadales bacterium]